MYAYAANNPVHYIDPDGKLIRKSDGFLKVEQTGKNITLSISSNGGEKNVSYEMIYLFTDKGNKVMAFKNLSYTPLWQDSTGEAIADGLYSFDLNVSDKHARELKQKIGYNPTEAINQILNDEYETCSKEEATIAVNKMKNGFLSIKKFFGSKSIIGKKQFFVQTSRNSEHISLDKTELNNFQFYKEME